MGWPFGESVKFQDPPAQFRIFADRLDAGERLADALCPLGNRPEAAVLGLPRGGVITAAAVAKKLRAPLDVWVVRKIRAPASPELAIGALCGEEAEFINREIVRDLGVSERDVSRAAASARREARRMEKLYRRDRPPLRLKGRAVVLVDDGLATGATMRAAIDGVRRAGASSVAAAVPVAAPGVIPPLSGRADNLIGLLFPRDFKTVSAYYQDFKQVTDREVSDILAAFSYR